MIITRSFWIAGVAYAASAAGAEYRIVPASSQVNAGETAHVLVEVETEPGDNVVGLGYFSFAIDFAVAGTAGASAFDVANIVPNITDFDDVLNGSLGFPTGSTYRGIAGVTTDLFSPSFGYEPGDIVTLFTFDLHVPPAAQPGDYIDITPAEGILENLVTGTFEQVSPQRFNPATISIIPEPSTLVLLLALTPMILRRRDRN